MSAQGIEPRDEPRFVLPEFLQLYPGKIKRTEWVIEQIRVYVHDAITEGVISIKDQPFTLDRNGDYTKIGLLVRENKALTKLQLEALSKLCKVVSRLPNLDSLLLVYVAALQGSILNIALDYILIRAKNSITVNN